MASVQLRGVFCQDWVLIPQNEEAFYQELRLLDMPESALRRLVQDVEKSTLSIRHKLTVVMYQAALISNLNLKEFADFEEKARNDRQPLRPSMVSHHGYSARMNNIQEYRLYMALFLETFSATAFSLLDVSSHLLNELYKLGDTADKISFSSILAKTDFKTKSIYPFLAQYAPGNDTSVPWIKPLKGIRNRTTHRPITDVCKAEIIRQGDFLKPMPDVEGYFYLDPALFHGNKKPLVDFVKEVYEGLEVFVEDLYDNLRQSIIRTQSTTRTLPLD